MSVLNGAYKHPANASSIYSEGLRNLIDFMLRVNPSERPGIHQVRLAFPRPYPSCVLKGRRRL